MGFRLSVGYCVYNPDCGEVSLMSAFLGMILGVGRDHIFPKKYRELEILVTWCIPCWSLILFLFI